MLCRLVLRTLFWACLLGSLLTAHAAEPLRLQLKWHHQFQFAGYYAALQQGYYADEGLAVEIIEGSADLPPIAQVLTGQADYAIGDSDLLLARLSGKPLVALAAVFQHSPYVLLSLEKSQIKSPKDLLGKRIMLSQDQGALQFKAMLLKQHLDIRQMTLLPHTWRLQDLIEGKVDAISAYAMDEPVQLQQRGIQTAVISNQDYGVDFYGDILFTTERETRVHPERVDAFLRATKKGWAYAFNHKQEMAQVIARMSGVAERGLNTDTLLQEANLMVPYVLSEVVPWGKMHSERWQMIANTFARLGLMPTQYSLDGFVYENDLVLKRPYWIWLTRGAVGLMLVLGGFFIWNLQMRRQVRLRTEALEAEIAHRKQTEILLGIAGEVAKIGGWVLDLATQRIHWSDEVAILHDMPPGYSPTLEEGMAMFVPEYRSEMMAAIRRCIDEGVPYDLELEKITANGRRVWVRAIGQPVRDAQGNIIKLQGSLQDISAQKQWAAIQQGQDSIQSMMLADMPLQHILQTAVELIEQPFPDACCVLLLLDDEGQVTQHMHSMRFSAAGLPMVQSSAWRLPATAVRRLQTRILGAEMHAHPLSQLYHSVAGAQHLQACWSQPLLSRSSQLLGVVAMLRQLPHTPPQSELDVVDSYAQILGLAIEREHADKQLHLLQNGVARLNDIVMIIEAPLHTPMQQRIVFLNEAFTRITGLAVSPLLGVSPFEVFKEATPARELQRIKQAFQAHTAMSGEVVTVNRLGAGIALEMDAIPLHDKGGRVAQWVTVLRDITERKQADARIRQLAYYDTMTGLPNRMLLQDKLASHIRKAMRKQQGGALLFIDIDNFKTLNDTHGHAVGDALLKAVAKRLSHAVRRHDTVSRLGGDEFVIVLDQLHADVAMAEQQARRVCDKILQAFKPPFQLDQHQHLATPSIGVVLFDAERLSQPDELLRKADMAMYKAKEAGRNAYRFFDTQMETELRHRVALEADLHLAIADEAFVLHLQPQYDQQGRQVGAEALLRWQHPERGLIMPGQFIGLAEDTGQIVALGRWVMREACLLLQRWTTHPELGQLVLAVNVSPKQYLQPDFVTQVAQLLRLTGIAPHRLKLELTESMLVDNVEDIIDKMQSLKALGVCFSLDDFGTGYSSLSYLKRLPFDQLKIDQSFVRDMLHGQDHESIVNAIISLGQSLQLEILAEGVETEAQWLRLKALGCQIFQGYHFTRPVPVEVFEAGGLWTPKPLLTVVSPAG